MTASMPSRAMLNERFHHKLAKGTIVMLSFFCLRSCNENLLDAEYFGPLSTGGQNYIPKTRHSAKRKAYKELYHL